MWIESKYETISCSLFTSFILMPFENDCLRYRYTLTTDIEKIWNSFSYLGNAFNFRIAVRFVGWYLNIKSLCGTIMGWRKSYGFCAVLLVYTFLFLLFELRISLRKISIHLSSQFRIICNILLIFVLRFSCPNNVLHRIVCIENRVRWTKAQNMAHYIRWAFETLHECWMCVKFSIVILTLSAQWYALCYLTLFFPLSPFIFILVVCIANSYA